MCVLLPIPVPVPTAKPVQVGCVLHRKSRGSLFLNDFLLIAKESYLPPSYPEPAQPNPTQKFLTSYQKYSR